MSARPVVAVAVSMLMASSSLLAACSSTDDASTVAGPVSPPESSSTCPDGFTLDAAIEACVEISAPGPCPANTMPEIGKADCQPVGWTTPCPEGFVPGRSGWGCVDRFPVPAPKCAGATREDLKTGTCVPIGDCSAQFPPAAATLFVDDDGLEDATHFHTLKQAMSVATKGATIAVESGTYSEFLELLVDDVTVAGRCAQKVVFQTPTPGGPRAGIYLPGDGRAKLTGVTVTGYRGGALVEGGDLTLEDTLIDGNDTLGLYTRFGSTVTMRRSKISNTTPGVELGSALVVYDGSTVTLEDSAVVDNYFRHATVDGKAGAPLVSTLIAKRSVFARNGKQSSSEAAIAVINGGVANLSQSAILDAFGQGLYVNGAGSRAELTESVIRRTQGKLADSNGVGVLAISKGVVKLVSSAVTDHPVLGVYGGKGTGTVILEKSVIAGVPVAQKVEFGRGASASEGGRLEMTDTAVVGCPQSGIGLQMAASGAFEHVYVADSRPYDTKTSIGEFGGFGMLVEGGSTATVNRSSFVGNALAGMTSAQQGEVTAEAVLIRGTNEVVNLSAGSGVQVSRATMKMTRSAIAANSSESVIVATGGVFVMTNGTIHGTTVDSKDRFGHGIAVFTTGRAELTDTSIYDNAGVGLVSDGGEASVRGGTIAKNSVALHAQNGATISQSDGADDLAVGEVRISSSTRFVDNQTRIGSGVVMLPKPPID